MSTESNKTVVRKFWNELLANGDVQIADEVVQPDYVNLIVEGLQPPEAPGPGTPAEDSRESLKELVRKYQTTIKAVQFDELAMAAEGDSVFARFNVIENRVDGTSHTARVLGYYKIVDGRIALNDVMSVTTD